ncbi:HD domain-containing protein [Thalassolituus sp. LLYu03]|uniref:HD domain-containing protein n=1 Tax=Thalassolituus sp. LLYu03 TaxID=3421656 RepID=UPI003D2B349E
MRLRTLARKAVDSVWRPFEDYGQLHLGEDITQRAHALQCAWFASEDNAPGHLVIAALLHDIGHLLTWDETGAHPEEKGLNGYHEKNGATFLGRFFADDITKPVRLHVAAKRYLASTDAEYRTGLSQASLQSLELQGGLMDDSTCRAFEASPWFTDALRLRKYDELGKQLGLSVPDIDHYYELLIQHTRVVQERVSHV